MKGKISKIFSVAIGILVLSFLVFPQIRESGVIEGVGLISGNGYLLQVLARSDSAYASSIKVNKERGGYKSSPFFSINIIETRQ